MEKLALSPWIDEAVAANLSLGQFFLQTQAAEMELTEEELLLKMQRTLSVMREAITYGLSGVRSTGGLAGGDGLKLQQYHARSGPTQSLLGSVSAKAASYALAANEANAAMGKICAAPTAGSSGILPAVLFAIAEDRYISRRELSMALIVAGTIGMVIASRASLSGAEGGCQAECGSAAAMTAGAAVNLLGGTPEQVGHATALALKNLLGLVCDPVAGLVEVPCVKRNAGGAMIALLSAEMALAGIRSVIPVDEVIDAMSAVGHTIDPSLRETGLGGLASTPTGIACAARIFGAKNHPLE